MIAPGKWGHSKWGHSAFSQKKQNVPIFTIFQGGFVLVSVMFALAVVALLAFVMNREAGQAPRLAGGGLTAVTAEYVAEAALEHAQWSANRAGCMAYDLPTAPFGAHAYQVSYTPTVGSPVAITATGTLADGTARTRIRNEVRVYEPSVTLVLQPDAAEGKDTWLYDWKPNWNHGTDVELQISSQPGANGNGLVRFDLSAIPATATIRSAVLELRENAGASAIGGQVDVHRVTADWSEGTSSGGTGESSWDDRMTGVAWSSGGGDFDPTPYASTFVPSAAPGWHSWDVTQLVADWHAGTYPNRGLALELPNPGGWLEFDSSDASTAANRPKLTVTYVCECALGTPQTVLLKPGSTDGKDAWYTGSKTNWNYGNHNKLLAQENAGQRAAIEFDLSVLPPDAQVQSAELRLYAVNAPTAGNVDLHAFADDWVEGTCSGSGCSADGITWDTRDGTNAWTTPGGDFVTPRVARTAINGAGAWYAFDVTNAVGTWVASGTNHGLLIKGNAGGVDVDFASSEEADATLHPELELTYTCSCGVCPPTTIGTVLMVSAGLPISGPGGTFIQPTAQEQLRIDLIESWNFDVELIMDDAAQSEFDAALASADVAYVPATIDDTVLGTKLVSATIGVVSEETQLKEEFGFANDVNLKGRTDVDVVDNSHYITAPLVTGVLSLFTSTQSMPIYTASVAPGAQTLADVFNVGSLWEHALLVLDAGATLDGGGTAAGRRVALPWDEIDVAALNADGQGVLRRALEWGSGLGSGGGPSGPAPGPVAHWALDDGTGTTAVDSVGGHDATLSGGGWVAGHLGDAVSLNGSSDYLSAPDDDTLDLVDAFTLMGWVNNDTLSGYDLMFNKGDAGNDQNYWLGTNGDEVTFGFHDGAFQEFETTTANLSAGTWYHLAATFDDAADTVTIYLDGALLVSQTTTAAPLANDGALYLGRSQHGEYVDGALDDLRIFDYALDAGEIATYAAMGGGPSGGVVYEGFAEARLASSGTSLAVPKPAGTAAGDLLVAMVATDGGTAWSMTPPPGWTPVTVEDRAGKVSFGVWWRVASGSEGSDYSFTWSGGEEAYGAVLRFTGHDPASPINDSATSQGKSSSPTSPAVTTTVADALIVRLGGFDGPDITVDAPGLTGHTAVTMDRSSSGSNAAAGAAGYVAQASAGSSGSSDFALTGSEEYVTVTIAIAPAP